MAMRSGCAALAVALAAGGCTMMGPDYERPRTSLPGAFAGEPQEQAAAVRPDWWRLYHDPHLDRLVERTLEYNTDLQQAAARLDEAEAVLREARAVLVPGVDLEGSATRSRITTAGAQPVPAGVPVTRSDFRIALTSAFELDFWGRLRRAAQAAEAQSLSSRYALDTAALTLAGITAQTWFMLRSLDAQVAVTRESLRAREESLSVVQARARGGLVSDLDVNQAEASRADAAVQLEDLLRQRDAVQHQLGALTGQLDLQVPAGDLRRLPVPPLPPPGLPSTLLDRRPDVRQAETALVAANALVGVSIAETMPSISLTGAFGAQSRELSDLLSSPARIASFGLALNLPLFDSGRLQARTEQARARERQARAAWAQSIENAFREVADALTNSRHASAVEQDLDRRTQAARNGVRLATSRYEAGYSGYLEVLDALRVQHEAELASIRNRQARLAFSVDLMKALGGGWSETGSAPAAAPSGQDGQSSQRDQPRPAFAAEVSGDMRNGDRSRSSSSQASMTTPSRSR